LGAETVIVTATHKTAAGTLSELTVIYHVKNIRSTSVEKVDLGFPEGAVQMDHEGTGLVSSKNSDFAITACTSTIKKWPRAAPEGKALL
ncbi:UNVERIFIED_CONTAM: protoporphyrinogen oxidase, partial [Bacillus subtilis]